MTHKANFTKDPNDAITADGTSAAPFRGRHAACNFVAVGVLGVLGWWAFRPLPEVSIDTPRESAPSLPRAGPEPTRLALDLAAFHAPLWIAPPAPTSPPVPPKPVPPPPPIRLQILAIVRGGVEGTGGSDGTPGADGQSNRALLYDPETDKPIWVRSGLTIGPRTVERVTAEAVELREGTLLRTLVLREPKPASTALEHSLRGSGVSR